VADSKCGGGVGAQRQHHLHIPPLTRRVIFKNQGQPMALIRSLYDLIQGPGLDVEKMDQRLKARLSLVELFGISFCLAFVGIFIWLISIGRGYPPDFGYYVGNGIASNFYYGYWILPFFALFKLLPFTTAYGLFCCLIIFSLFFTVRVFGGKPVFVLLSYQILSSMFYGQIAGLLAGGLALCWWGIAHKKWGLAGLGFLFAATKYQVGVFGLILIWYSGISWRDFFKTMLVPVGGGLISLILYPLWPLEIIRKFTSVSYTQLGFDLGITFWIYIGVWSLLFWLPGIFLPINKKQRFFAWLSLVTFATPYFQHIDLLTLFAFPIGWLPIIGYFGLLFPLINVWAVRLVALVPFLIYLTMILTAALDRVRRPGVQPAPTQTD
jgi:hypothetical protein